MKRYKKVAVGGTFDEFHRGHRVLLMKAFVIGEKVAIGLCSDKFVAKMDKPHITASYQERLKELKEFLSDLGVLGRALIVPIDDPFGTTLSESCIEALVVSEETEPVGLRINEKRQEAGLQQLEIVTVTMVPSENSAPISTTRIRKGEMDREGHIFQK